MGDSGHTALLNCRWYRAWRAAAVLSEHNISCSLSAAAWRDVCGAGASRFQMS